MKRTLHSILFSAAFLTFTAHAQQMMLPNGDLDDWLNNEPISWNTNNAAFPGAVTEVAGNGGAAAQGTAVYSALIMQVVPPLLMCNADGDMGFAVDADYTYISFDYKLDAADGEAILFALTLNDGADQMVGISSDFISGNTSTWTTYTALIDYTGSGAQTGAFYVSMSGIETETVTEGSNFQIDNVRLTNSGTVNVEEQAVSAFAFNGIFPNPASDQAFLSLSLPQNQLVQVEVVDLAGRVASSQNFNPGAGEQRCELSVSGLPSGLYLVRAQTGEAMVTRRLRVVR